MPPRSILKKRPAPVPRAQPEDEIEEVSAEASASKAAEVDMNNEESSEDDESESGSDDGDSYDETDEDGDDEDDILEMGERPAKKLKHTTLRPTAAPTFSLALNHLLNLPQSTSTLTPKNAPPSAVTQRLERRAKSLLRETKSNHLARGHVRDVIVGWGARPNLPFSQWDSVSARAFARAQNGDGEDGGAETGAEREKRLRRLAQRGVVRLFNAIGAAQGAPAKADKEEAKKRKREAGLESEMGSTATGFTGVGAEGEEGKKTLRRPNVLGGRGKGEALSNLSKASFLDLIRAGTTSSTPLIASR